MKKESRVEEILQAKIDGEASGVKPMSRVEVLLEQLNADGGGSVDPSVLDDIANLKTQMGDANVNIEELTTRMDDADGKLAKAVSTDQLVEGNKAVSKLVSPGTGFVRSHKVVEVSSDVDLAEYIDTHKEEFYHSSVSVNGDIEYTILYHKHEASDYRTKHWPYKNSCIMVFAPQTFTDGIRMIAMDMDHNYVSTARWYGVKKEEFELVGNVYGEKYLKVDWIYRGSHYYSYFYMNFAEMTQYLNHEDDIKNNQLFFMLCKGTPNSDGSYSLQLWVRQFQNGGVWNPTGLFVIGIKGVRAIQISGEVETYNIDYPIQPNNNRVLINVPGLSSNITSVTVSSNIPIIEAGKEGSYISSGDISGCINPETLPFAYTPTIDGWSSLSVGDLYSRLVAVENQANATDLNVDKILQDYVTSHQLVYGNEKVAKLVAPGSTFVRGEEVFSTLDSGPIDFLEYIQNYYEKFFHSSITGVGYPELTLHHYDYPSTDYTTKHWPFKKTVIMAVAFRTYGIAFFAFNMESRAFMYSTQTGTTSDTWSGWMSYVDSQTFSSFTNFMNPIPSKVESLQSNIDDLRNTQIPGLSSAINGVRSELTAMSSGFGTRISANETGIDALEENVQALEEEVHDPLILDNILEIEGPLPEVLPDVLNDAALEEMYLYTYFIPKDGSSRIPDKQAGMETLYNLIVKAVDKRVTDLMKKDIEKNTTDIATLSKRGSLEYIGNTKITERSKDFDMTELFPDLMEYERVIVLINGSFYTETSASTNTSPEPFNYNATIDFNPSTDNVYRMISPSTSMCFDNYDRDQHYPQRLYFTNARILFATNTSGTCHFVMGDNHGTSTTIIITRLSKISSSTTTSSDTFVLENSIGYVNNPVTDFSFYGIRKAT